MKHTHHTTTNNNNSSIKCYHKLQYVTILEICWETSVVYLINIDRKQITLRTLNEFMLNLTCTSVCNFVLYVIAVVSLFLKCICILFRHFFTTVYYSFWSDIQAPFVWALIFRRSVE